MCLSFEQIKDKNIIIKLEKLMSTKMMDKQVNTMSNKMVDSESDASEILDSTTNLATGELTKF